MVRLLRVTAEYKVLQTACEVLSSLEKYYHRYQVEMGMHQKGHTCRLFSSKKTVKLISDPQDAAHHLHKGTLPLDSGPRFNPKQG